MKKFPRFNRSGLPNSLDFYQKHLKKILGHGEWRLALCPFHDDHNPSLSINIDRGSFRCFTCDASGGDVLDFYRRLHNVDFKTAAKSLGAWSRQ